MYPASNMNRRKFIERSGLAAAALAVLPSKKAPNQATKAKSTMLSAYYFRAHMYTMVPRHVREDMKWMAGIGTKNVCVAVLEQDLTAAIENISLIKEEAAKEGIKLMVVPSRWGGLLAGAPKVPSLFTVTHPNTWLLKKDKTFYTDQNVGVHSSIHYDDTVNFFCNSLDQVVTLWAPAGIIWDEPKIYDKPDYSPEAVKKLKDVENVSLHNKAFSNFFSYLNAYIKSKNPDIITNLFAYANLSEGVIESASAIEDLDYFGCDGRPWRVEDGGKVEQEAKVLLGPGERFLKAAKMANKKSLYLIENHNMREEDIHLMNKRLPEVLSLQPDHLIYYYYPRNVDKPEMNMTVLAHHLKKIK